MTRSKPFLTCRRVQCDMMCPPVGSRTNCHHLQPIYAAIIEKSNLAAQATLPSTKSQLETPENEVYVLVFNPEHDQAETLLDR